MEYMLRFAPAFNQDLSAWDVSSVTAMRSMFYGASVFNQDLSGWDVSSVTSMERMFRSAPAFKQNLCPWASKSPQLAFVTSMFVGASSCNRQTTPRLKSGIPGDPHDGPFCFTC
eukprot:scaffold6668_cov75-Attheya_sp.AAC.2